jgi:enamine deaminase RidA (YjgF/YER057c/UK114 family)
VSNPLVAGAEAGARRHGPVLDLRYRPCRELEDADPSRILGGLAYGIQHAVPPPLAKRVVRVYMPVLDGEDFCAVWMSERRVAPVEVHGVAGAHDGELLFGALEIRENDGLDALSEDAYRRVFDFVDDAGYPHLLRTWNYFPRINVDAAGTERYRRFNAGRHAAFRSKGRVVGQNTPAACALGSAGGPLTIAFLAGREPGTPIENPRQVSAYRYPRIYGARSPTFSRAMLVGSNSGKALLISGTSSIVGHETLHAEDVGAQVVETLANIEAVLGKAGWSFERLANEPARFIATVYVRRRADVAVIRSAVERVLRPPAEVRYVEADVCRAELMIEIEAALFVV